MPFEDLDKCVDLGSIKSRRQLDRLDGDGPRGKILQDLDQPALGEVIAQKDIGTDENTLARARRQQARYL